MTFFLAFTVFLLVVMAITRKKRNRFTRSGWRVSPKTLSDASCRSGWRSSVQRGTRY